MTQAPWEHRRDGAGQVVDVAAEKAIAMANEISKDIPSLVPLLPRILTGSQRQAYVFGRRLGQSTPHLEELILSSLAALERIDAKEANPSFVAGVVSAVQERCPALYDKVFSLVEANERLVGRIAALTGGSRPYEPYLDRILQLIHLGKLPVGQLYGLSYGQRLDHIPPSYLSEFCSKLTALGREGAWVALDVIFIYAHGEPQRS